jgi:putative ABC transport system permease protein
MLKLALKRIARAGVRSWGVGLAALLVASFALGVIQVLLGAQASLHQAVDRLGADIVVVPEGVAVGAESALLMGLPDQSWMPPETLERVAAVSGVALASPQLYLAKLYELACCPGQEVLLIAYDPATDFTIRPWLQNESQAGLKMGEAVAGSEIAAYMGSNGVGDLEIEIGGFPVRLAAALEPTGTRLDQALFLSFETAAELAVRSDLTLFAIGGVPGEISAVMVQVDPGVNPYAIAVQLMHEVPGTNPVTSLDLFQAYRRQLSALLRSVAVVMTVTLIVSILLTGLIFSMAANERRQELGVLRALGATRTAVFRSLVLEAGLLACGGGLAGGLLTGVGITAFHRVIVEKLEIPFLPPSPTGLILQIGVGLGVALAIVTAAVLLPAYRISREEPAFAMRE